jgi:hypothetical protein
MRPWFAVAAMDTSGDRLPVLSDVSEFLQHRCAAILTDIMRAVDFDPAISLEARMLTFDPKDHKVYFLNPCTFRLGFSAGSCDGCLQD